MNYELIKLKRPSDKFSFVNHYTKEIKKQESYMLETKNPELADIYSKQLEKLNLRLNYAHKGFVLSFIHHDADMKEYAQKIAQTLCI